MWVHAHTPEHVCVCVHACMCVCVSVCVFLFIVMCASVQLWSLRNIKTDFHSKMHSDLTCVVIVKCPRRQIVISVKAGQLKKKRSLMQNYHQYNDPRVLAQEHRQR